MNVVLSPALRAAITRLIVSSQDIEALLALSEALSEMVRECPQGIAGVLTKLDLLELLDACSVRAKMLTVAT